jgi:hypothetical protein
MGLRTRTALLAVGLVNLITNPLLGYALLVTRHLAGSGAHATVASVVLFSAGEAIVVVAEWRLLLWVLGGSSRRLFRVSLAMNLASALAGILLWWP